MDRESAEIRIIQKKKRNRKFSSRKLKCLRMKRTNTNTESDYWFVAVILTIKPTTTGRLDVRTTSHPKWDGSSFIAVKGQM